MKITVKALTDNSAVLNAARTTVWKDSVEKEPSEKFMNDIYFAEHSPIRAKEFLVEIYGVKSWVTTHLCRHSIGYTPFISTQRDDRHISDVPRDELPQGALVNMQIILNAQAFINVSRKRLCYMAHVETRNVWENVVEELRLVDPILARYCVKNCCYRNGICSEGKNCCGFCNTSEFQTELSDYLGAI